ncbi:MAG: DUF4124 domain-containing protein [Gammaproteobacteria bacterium]|nr:DUF4124 domain-containing protein [Gammaproteobacteria bacterium]MDH5515062.1 DUF4124 domain-containing protein [Gammaproteobacteria bacterium]
MKQLPGLIGLLLATLLLSSPAHAEDVYKWVNKDNEVQYTQMPPPHGIKAIRIQSKAPDAEDSNDDAASAPEAEASPPDTEQAAEDAPEAETAEAPAGDEQAETPDRNEVLSRASQENCEKARRNLENLNRGNVRLRTSSGEVIRLTEEERQQKIVETNAQIELFCE